MDEKCGSVPKSQQQARVLVWVFAGLLSLFMPVIATAQTYSVRMEPINYQAMPSSGFPGGETPIDFFTSSTQWHEAEHLVTIPWEFRFFGERFSVMRAGADGLVTFGNDRAVAMNPAPIPSSATPNNLVAIWWTRLLCNSSSNLGIVRSQVVGTTPNRRLVVDWPNCRAWGITTTRFKFQIWLTEGSDDIEVRYGEDVGTSTAVQASIGVENATGTDGTSVICNGFCSTADFPEGMALIYSAGPNIRVSDLRGGTEGFAGIRFPVDYTLSNPGSKPANGFTVRYWVHTEPVLDGRAIPVGYANRTWSLEPKDSVHVADSPTLPIQLEAGSYYLIVEGDPHHAVDLSNRSGAIGVFGPFTLGIRAANLVAERVEGREWIVPGEPVEVEWAVRNAGNLDTSRVGVRLALGSTPFVFPSTLVLGEASIDQIPMGETVSGTTTVVVPEGVEPGVYYLGLAVDPTLEIFEHERLDNTVVSPPVLVVGDGLSILTSSLPPAEVQGNYSVRLMAHGGDGVHRWTVREGTTLPLGLSLVEEMGSQGNLATFLRGVPAALGAFPVALEVHGGGQVASRTFQLEVQPVQRSFSITSDHLAQASFGSRYVNALTAHGGTPPYTWDVKGALPLGILMRNDGVLSGTPEQDGSFPFTILVRDDEGREAQRQFELYVAPPSALTCVTKELPTLEIGQSVRTELIAAGGRKFPSGSAYRWRTESTAKVATTSLADEGEILSDPPPGIRLQEGWALGAPTEFGSFVWKLLVRDEAGDEILCPILVNVPPDHGLTVVTRGLPVAVAGRSYRAHLAAVGGDGVLEWSELGSGMVLWDLGLEIEGSALVGTPDLTALEGEPEKEFTFLLRVADEKGRVGYHALDLRVLAEAPRQESRKKEEGGGCAAASASGGAGALAPWLLVVAGLGLRRRR